MLTTAPSTFHPHSHVFRHRRRSPRLSPAALVKESYATASWDSDTSEILRSSYLLNTSVTNGRTGNPYPYLSAHIPVHGSSQLLNDAILAKTDEGVNSDPVNRDAGTVNDDADVVELEGPVFLAIFLRGNGVPASEAEPMEVAALVYQYTRYGSSL